METTGPIPAPVRDRLPDGLGSGIRKSRRDTLEAGFHFCDGVGTFQTPEDREAEGGRPASPAAYPYFRTAGAGSSPTAGLRTLRT